MPILEELCVENHNSMKYSIKLVLFCIALCAVAMFLALKGRTIVLLWDGAKGVRESVEIANRMQWPELLLSTDASDVSFFISFYESEAEFAIPEESLLDWCQSKGWDVTKISTPLPYFEPLRMDADLRLVARGYRFSLPEGWGVFDADRSRAAFAVSTFP